MIYSKKLKAVAKEEIREALQNGKLMTGDLIEFLGYDLFDLCLTLYIGDQHGWVGSVHQSALYEMCEEEHSVIWHKDEEESVWYELMTEIEKC